MQENLPEEKANLLLGILVGYKDEIPKKVQENFKESNISHVLAVSGLHVSYIIIAISKSLEKIQGKRTSKITTIFIIILYMFITNFSPSVVRAGLMGIISIAAKLTYNKNDIWTSIAISMLLILVYNPYLIISSGVLLSYGGTIGIITFQKSISLFLVKIKSKSKIYKYNSKARQIIDYIQDTLVVSFSAQILIWPIIAKMYNTMSFSFFITNFLVSPIIGPIIILGFLFIISNFLFPGFIRRIIKFILENLLQFLITISNLGKYLPFNKIYIPTPEIWQIFTYYIVIYIINIIYKISVKRKATAFQKRLINWKNLIKHLLRKHSQKVLGIILCITIIGISIKIIPNNLKIYFIDVGQGDSTLVVTPQGKTILIDGGGSETYDVGKNILVPYLLDRKVKKLDYVIISHFDTDHVGGILTVIEELDVKKVIIGKQYDICENYKEFLKIIRQKNILVKQVQKGDKINVEKNVQISILFPEAEMITENSLNNNSLVLKLVYKDFSILFTGDIEQIAEERLVKCYSKSNILKSTILKVAHHGSKTSSIQEFLELVQPQIALIGVGKNNLYGHPNQEVIERLKNIGAKIYRTDNDGEIIVEVNKRIKIQKTLN